MTALPLVSLVMPVRNEAAHLARSFAAIDAQTYPPELLEIAVVDGGSTDGTLALVEARKRADRRTSLHGGRNVSTPAAMEVGIAQTSGELIAKVDGHGWVNPEFIEEAVTELLSDASIGCVGGTIEPIAETTVERAIAIARFSHLGVGGGVYTLAKRPQDAETVQCGVYRRTALSEAGGFDPNLAFGEDEEVNLRLRQHGWRIRLNPAMRFSYHVRPSLRSLWHQYFRYGRARVAVVRKHPSFFKMKHAVPAAAVFGLVASLPLSAVPAIRWVTAAIWLGYAAIIVGGGAWLAIRHRFPRADLVMAALLALHLGYGLGTFSGARQLSWGERAGAA